MAAPFTHLHPTQQVYRDVFILQTQIGYTARTPGRLWTATALSPANPPRQTTKPRSSMASFAPLTVPVMAGGRSKKKVNYFYDVDIGNFAYEPGHPMKPHRIRMAHSLIMKYNLYTKMEIHRAMPATIQEMGAFHTPDYLSLLKSVKPENRDTFEKRLGICNLGFDSPIFDGLFEFCTIYAGNSMEGAARLAREKCEIAVNWAGGLHHAKKAESSGFCYVNDIVLAILELLRFHARVLYIDIDVHHGDGVEEAFFTTDRVMTVSFHQYGEFFPATGELRDHGIGRGKNYSVNFPLRPGIDDVSYKGIFEAVINKVMERYRPGAIVLQCGADSLSGDKLGRLNLSMRGHANCIEFVKSFNVPTLILGGGGYTIKNVSRTWAYETGLILNQPMDPVIPRDDEYYDYYAPDYELDVKASSEPDANGRDYLNKITIAILENLKDIDFAPSAQMTEIPPDFPGMSSDAEDELDDEDEDENSDLRYTQRRRDKLVADEDGYVSESDDEEAPKRSSRRNISGYPTSSSSPSDDELPVEEEVDEEPEEELENDAEENGERETENDRAGLKMEAAAENGSPAADEEWEKVGHNMNGLEIKDGQKESGADAASHKEDLRSKDLMQIEEETPSEPTEGTPPSPALSSSAELTPEPISDASELQGDTVMVDAPLMPGEGSPKSALN